MIEIDYKYPFKVTWQCDVKITCDGVLESEDNNLVITDDHTILLRFHYTALHKRKPGVISVNGLDLSEQQYFESGQKGIRYLNLTGITNTDKIVLNCQHCKITSQGQLLGFKNPDLSRGPILILAPHADDAELAAYGLYSDHAPKTWIATINSGANTQKLNRQYIPNLDNNMEEAVRRKGYVRSWNSMTTPLLAKVPVNQLFCLGYFDISSSLLRSEPEKNISHPLISALTPNDFRQWNQVKLSNDTSNINSGAALIKDIVELIEHIKPETILVTHPEIDPHDEHIVAACALHSALQTSSFIPNNILFYVNHLRDIKLFPYGPEHARSALPPWFKSDSLLSDSSCYSHSLSLSKQKEKVLAFDTMHDLRSKDRFEKKIKRWVNQKIKKNGYQYYGNHSYFQTHIKADEVFICLAGCAYKNTKL
ncbi:MAG: hypothetical protein GY951_11900 [Psychromonas sp.]|nr:hypothetical protein [Alteromonadales bacterium]MCP5078744.1 hypothetical protein [Psychromonas sp.]